MINPKKIWNSSQLPSLPTVAIKLLELSKNEETEIADVVKAIQTDPAISAKILKASNSSFFGLRSKVTSLDRAVPLLGTTVVTSLALSFSLVDTSMQKGEMVEFYDAYWRQSIVQAATAEILAKKFFPKLQGEFFLMGLLIDLGQLAMLKTIAGDYHLTLKANEQFNEALHKTEMDSFGFDHAEIGGKLMEKWNLPDEVVTSSSVHHKSFEEVQEMEYDSPEMKNMVQAAMISSALGDYFCTNRKGESIELLKVLSSEYYSYSKEELNDLIEEVRNRVDQAAELFSVDVSEIGDPGDMMAEANEQLAFLAMKEHVASTQAEARTELIEQEKNQLESKNNELKQQAFRDPLTKLYNRNFFNESLNNELHRSCREGTSIGIIFTDIDKFKNLNDTYGHQFGDEVLIKVSQLIQDSLRKCDVVARFGGEEFVILVQQPTEKGIAKVAERLRAKIESLELSYEGEKVPVTSSFGAVIAIPKLDETDLGETLIAQADEAMYESKQNGRNRVYTRSLISEKDRKIQNMMTQFRFSRWLVGRGVIDIANASQVLLKSNFEYLRLGNLATANGFLTEEQLETIIEKQKTCSERIGEIAVELGYMNIQQLSLLLSQQKESPVEFMKTVISMGLIPPHEMADLYKAYIEETNSHLGVNLPVSVN